MFIGHGHWDELPNQCKSCLNLRTMSAYMDGNNTYGCGKYPLKDGNTVCPEFDPTDDIDECPFDQQLKSGNMVCDDGMLGAGTLYQCPTSIFNKCQAGLIRTTRTR